MAKKFSWNGSQNIDTVSGSSIANTATTFPITEKGRAGLFNGSTSKITIGNKGNLKTVAFWLRLKTTTEQIFEGDPNAHLIHANAGTLTYPDWDNAFVDSIDTNTIDTQWHSVVITSTTSVDCTDIELALNNAAYGNLYIAKCEGDTEEWTQSQINNFHKKFLKASPTTETKTWESLERIRKPSTLNEDGLVAAYNMVPSEGGVLADIAEITPYDGTIVGPISTLNGMAFDGVDDYVNIDSALISLATTTQGTWSAWVKPVDATPATLGMILAFGDTNGNRLINFYINTTGRLKIDVVYAGSTKWSLNTDLAVFTDNTWTHIAVVQNGTEPVLYVNGVAVAQTFLLGVDKTVWFSDIPELDNGRIGSINRNNFGEDLFFNGEINDARIYNRALSPQEQKDYHNSFNLPTYTNKFLYEGADGITTNPPLGMIKGTGDYITNTVVLSDEDITIDLPWGTNYLECTSDGTISIPFKEDRFIDNWYMKKILYYNWSSRSQVWWDTVDAVVTANAWLSLANDKLTFTLTTWDRIAKIFILQWTPK